MISDVETSPVADLVMAILAVNQWRLDQSAGIYDSLKAHGLFEPETIATMQFAQLHAALKAAGYKKADFVIDLICDRLFDMAKKLSGDGAETFARLCASGDREAVRAFATTIKGVGPRVFENFWFLRTGRP